MLPLRARVALTCLKMCCMLATATLGQAGMLLACSPRAARRRWPPYIHYLTSGTSTRSTRLEARAACAATKPASRPMSLMTPTPCGKQRARCHEVAREAAIASVTYLLGLTTCG
eukprot:scaffold47417_cov56-Phaeocystis_antarctica.AAC.5